MCERAKLLSKFLRSCDGGVAVAVAVAVVVVVVVVVDVVVVVVERPVMAVFSLAFELPFYLRSYSFGQ